MTAPGRRASRPSAVTPGELTLVGIGSHRQLSVTGTYTNGASEDLTRKVQYSPNDESVVAVSPAGEITARRAGETAIMVRTLGKAIAARIAVIENPPLKDYPGNAAQQLHRRPGIREASPAEHRAITAFLGRRVCPARLSRCGRACCRLWKRRASSSHRQIPRKRAILIDRLLERPEFAEVWATRFSDLFRVGLLDQGHKGGRLMYTWLRNSIAADKPYNEFATELLTASGNLFFQPTANFYYVTEFSEPENIATNISQVFLGVRLECARCHNHPWEKWTQDDFWGFAAFFGRMGIKDTYQNDESQVLLRPKAKSSTPRPRRPCQPKYLDGPSETEGPDEDIREKLAAWMTAPGNPWFARAIVNRMVKHYLGRGLVEPVDDFRVTNPPSNEALLDALAQDFVRNGYSLRHTIRLLLNSRVYQLSSEPNETNRGDQLNYSRYYPKRLMAEQLDRCHLAGDRACRKNIAATCWARVP